MENTMSTMDTLSAVAMRRQLPGFKRVLVATDFSAASKAAFETALDLAKKLGAKLWILHVFEYADAVPPETGGRLIEIEGLYRDAENGMERLVKCAVEAGVEYQPMMAAGMVETTILEAIQSKGIDLVVMGTADPRWLERLIFGSTAEAVLRRARCAVMTVGPKVKKSLYKADGPVVFATDFHANSIHAVRYAAAAAAATRSELHCVTVLPAKTEREGKNGVLPAIMEEALKHVAAECGEEIGEPVTTTLFGGDIPDAVAEYAKRKQARLIVLGVRQRKAMAAHGPRQRTYRLIAEAPCPVLTVTVELLEQLEHTDGEAFNRQCAGAC